ncbi:MAG: LysM peptidoglycan-binding domain-containing protein [Candidatus Binataceae bacterium]
MTRSARYRPMMERIFQKYDLPKELVMLAAVESEFNPKARSTAGAVGIWQFMRSTGRDYDLVVRHHDYRYDPRRSTEAAARLLRANHERFPSWPLAITAYDYGAGAMAHAATVHDGNYLRILRHHDDPNFGFAVENYYSEFLATLEIYRHSSRYFPALGRPKAPALMAEHYTVRGGDTLSAIARRYGVSVASLIAENHIRDARQLRCGRKLLIPAGATTHYAYARGRHYTVRRGDTLYDLARQSGVSVKSLISANRIEDPRSLTVGRIICIPGA